MKTIGRHLIAELYGCDTRALNDAELIRTLMIGAAERCGATVMSDTFHKFEPHGVSGTVVISESHLSIHTWPESGYVAADIYTCGGLDPRPGFRFLGEQLRATRSRVQEILRGLPEDMEDHGMLLPEDVQIITRVGTLHLHGDTSPDATGEALAGVAAGMATVPDR